ncbi:hypothetical protein [Pedobacter sp. WC2423]|uniref:hypothetical protein n=1 Tax=Pedobacter sp. WC2423 TaxID=3234142 RepID=UPI0034666C96
MINTWEILKYGERLISSMENPPSANDVAYNSRVTPSFDMLFVQNSSGNYVLIIYMRIRIIYSDSAEPWKFIDKDLFEKDFKEKINRKWGLYGNETLYRLNSKKIISLDFRFSFSRQESYFQNNHWTLSVKKFNKGIWNQSSITSSLRTGKLDSNDFDFVKKKKNKQQRGAVHEFGHMLGLDDEYKPGAFVNDFDSIMNVGEVVRLRHRSVFIQWMQKVLREKKIN